MRLAVLTEFLDSLERAGIHFALGGHRPGMITVLVTVPGERWEVDFGSDGRVEVEVFTSEGQVLGDERLADLFARHSDASGADRPDGRAEPGGSARA